MAYQQLMEVTLVEFKGPPILPGTQRLLSPNSPLRERLAWFAVLRQTKVNHLERCLLSFAPEQEVLRFNISEQHPLGVTLSYGLEHLTNNTATAWGEQQGNRSRVQARPVKATLFICTVSAQQQRWNRVGLKLVGVMPRVLHSPETVQYSISFDR